jgi:hypothetical protein
MYSLRSKYWPAYTWKIQTSYLKDFKGSLTTESKISQDEFNSQLSNILDKINASFYHLQRLKENQDIAVKLGQALAEIKVPGMENLAGVAAAPYEPIGYEYESFLITVKSALDLIAILIATTFGKSERDIVSLVTNTNLNSLQKRSTIEKVFSLLKKKQFVDFIEEYKDPDKLQNKRSKRNFATHHGSLPIGTTNVPINNRKASILMVKPIDHNITPSDFFPQNTPDLTEFCNLHFYHLCNMFIGVLSILLDNKFKHGPKKSVYDARKLKK